MEHCFDVEIAKKYGIPAAVIYYRICSVIAAHAAEREKFSDKTYWTYDTLSTLGKIFPYLLIEDIEDAIQTLEREKLIVVKHTDILDEDRTEKIDDIYWFSVNKEG